MEHVLNTEITGPDAMGFIGSVVVVHGVAQTLAFLIAVVTTRGLEGDTDRAASKDLARQLQAMADSDAALACDSY